MKFSVNIYTWTQDGYQNKVVVEATVDAETPRAALQEVLDHWDLGDCPREIETVFEETVEEFHGMTGNKYSYDVCPASW